MITLGTDDLRIVLALLNERIHKQEKLRLKADAEGMPFSKAGQRQYRRCQSIKQAILKHIADVKHLAPAGEHP